LFFAFFIGLLIAGIIIAVKKLTQIKNYKVRNTWSEISAGRKTALCFTRIPMVIMLILTVDIFAGGLIAGKLIEIIWGK